MQTPTDDDDRPVGPEPDDVQPPADPEAPEADALEQAAPATPGPRRSEVAVPFEVSEADAIEQAEEVVDDEDGFLG